jgi:hypothetical protein
MKVYVNGYGLRPFRIEEETESPKQFKGSYKLPKNITRTDGEKWFELDYWFTENEIITS